MIEELPIWGQLSIIGVLVSIIVTVFIMYIRGDIVSRKAVDQAQKMADTFQEAWATSHAAYLGLVEPISKMVTGQETILRILEATPHKPGNERSGRESQEEV